MTCISRPTDRRPGFLNSASTFDHRHAPYLVNAARPWYTGNPRSAASPQAKRMPQRSMSQKWGVMVIEFIRFNL